MTRLLLALSLICSFSPSLSAQPPSLTGRVADPHGQPVAGAKVVVSGGTAPVTTLTDESGRFTFMGLADGRYHITVAAPGLVGEARDVATGSTVDIPMRAAAIAETLVVSATLIDQPLSRTADSVTVIPGRELTSRQITTLAGALIGVPGFTVTRTGGAGALASLFPRGGDSDFTLVLIDGIRANAFGGGMDLSQVPLGDVERIEVVRGPQSAIFGADAIGGVVQIITRQGGTPSAAASVEAGSRDTRRLQAMTTGEARRFRWQAGADYFEDAGFTGIAPATGERVSNDDAEERQAWVGGGWRGAGGTDVHATFRYVDTDRGAPGPYGSDPAGRFFGVDRVSRGMTQRRAVGLRVVHPWTGPASRLRQRADIDVADYDLDFVSGFGASASETRRTHVRVQTDAAMSARWGWSGGVELIDEHGRSSFILQGTTEVPVERRVLGLFGEARFDLHERMSVQAGLRAEHITREAFEVNRFADDAVTSVNPKVSLSWLVSPSLPGDRRWTRVRAAAGTGIRPPDMFEIAFTDNPGLKPERSRSFEIGVTQALLSGAVQLDATTFFNHYDDLIISVGSLRDVSRYRTDNVSNARARGLELGAAWRGPQGFNARAAYTLLDSEILAVDNVAQAPSPFAVGDALLRRPRHSGSLALGWTRARVSLFATIDARGTALDAEPSFGASGGLYRNPGRTITDLGGSVQVVRNVDLFARVTNLFDREYEEVFGYPSPGRMAFVGVRVATRR